MIKATNRQTAVLLESLESLTPFHKELEDFYTVREQSRHLSERIYYERRSKQYVGENISPRSIVTLTWQIKSFIGMFLNEPHSHPRYYGELLRAYEGRIFASDHKPGPYYASGVSLLTVEKWLNAHPSWHDLRFYKYQLLMLLRVLISGAEIPRLNSNAITEYSLKIADALRHPERREKECGRAAALLRDALNKVGRHSGERNPPHRLRRFTERLLDEPSSGQLTQNTLREQASKSPSEFETGRIIWYDGQRGYGFIERESGVDIFVHESAIGLIPWHLRSPNKRVRYQVIPNPRSPGMQMASRVELEPD